MTQPYDDPIETVDPIKSTDYPVDKPVSDESVAAMPEVISDPVEPDPSADLPDDLPPAADIVARGSNDYRVRRYIMVVLLLGFGGWFAYDGWVRYPAVNAEIARLEQAQREADASGNRDRYVQISEQLTKLGNAGKPLGLLLQKFLAVACPLAAVGFLIWTLRNSRGEYRLTTDDVLHAPGHPPVPMASITDIDRKAWDRKGIANIGYDMGHTGGTIRLDDFVYQRVPTDLIFERIERDRRAVAE